MSLPKFDADQSPADFEALNKDAGVELFLIYFGARAIREQAEAKF